MKNLHRSLFILVQFIRRDMAVYRRRLATHVTNKILIYPALYTISFAYLQTRSYFGDDTLVRTIMFSGNILLLVLTITFPLTITLLYDIEGNRYIDYQITLLSPKLILIEQIIFNTMFGFLLLLPFYPICKFIIGNQFDTTNTSWPQVILIIFAASLCCTTYHTLAACIMKNTRQIGNFWIRYNAPLSMFGGTWAPWLTIYAFSPLIGSLALLNPFTYVTEGIRSAIVGTPQFISVPTCFTILITCSILFTLACFHFFEKRMDCI